MHNEKLVPHGVEIRVHTKNKRIYDLEHISKIQQEIKNVFAETIPVDKINLNSTFSRGGSKEHLWGIGSTFVHGDKVYWHYSFGSWKNQGSTYTVKSWEGKQTRRFDEKLSEVIKERDILLAAEKQRRRDDCIERWKPRWEAAEPASINNPYLMAKQINPYVARQQKETLLIPIMKQNIFVGCQIIGQNLDGSFFKKFSFGIDKKGSYISLKPFEDAALIYVSEGFATAATIQEAIPSYPSIACIDCGNMVEAIKSIRSINPNCKIIIAADDDEKMAGEDAAKKAVKSFHNVEYRLPKFKNKEPHDTDFNDLHTKEGIGAVYEQLNEKNNIHIKALGHKNKQYFYTSTENSELVSIGAREHDEKSFFMLCTDEQYWLNHYGEMVDGEKRVNFKSVAQKLMGECHKNGIFDESRKRGIGIWRDGKDIVINDGNDLIGKRREDANFYYEKKSPRDLSKVVPSSNPIVSILSAIQNLNLKKPSDIVYISSWIVQSYIFPVLPWRYHIWITGGAGSGKTTLLNLLSASSPFVRGFQNATFMGLVQACGQDQTAAMIDEAEATGKAIGGLVDIARQMTSNSNFEQVRGTPSGEAKKLDPHIIFAFASIQHGISNAADVSRFFFIELDSKPVDHEPIKKAFYEAEKHQKEIFGWIYHFIPQILEYNLYVKKRLEGSGLRARQIDQLATAIACQLPFEAYRTELPDGWMDLYYQNTMEALGDLSNLDYVEDSNEKESIKALHDLWATIIDQDKTTVGAVISAIMDDNINGLIKSKYVSKLEAYGLKLLDDDTLFVSDNNQNLATACPKYPKLSSVLRQDVSIVVAGKEKYRTRLAGMQMRGVVISLGGLLNERPSEVHTSSLPAHLTQQKITQPEDIESSFNPAIWESEGMF